MNADRRKRIEAVRTMIEDKILAALEEAKEAIESIRDEEQEAFENLPESMRDGEKGEAMTNAIGFLEDAHGILNGCELQEVCDALGSAKD